MNRIILISLAFLPGILPAATRVVSPLPGTTGMTVDPSSRADVLAYYQTYYAASADWATRMGWSGNSKTGVAGTTSAAFKDDVLRRVNFYRGLCGYPTNTVFDATKSASCQQAALMMSANNNLSHFPPASWKFYTAAGASAAANANLALGSCGPDAIDSYMVDSGAGNEMAPHRRWMLYSLSAQMGTGDIPANNGFSASNALWVQGPPYTPSQPLAFATWPNEGYCPANLCPVRWSLSFPNADFSKAKVTMKRGATNVPVTISSSNDVGYGDSALVWQPTGGVTTDEGTAYTVTVTGIAGNGVPPTKTYTVTFFDPNNLLQTEVVSGPSQIPTSGSVLDFTPISGAQAYQVEVSQQSAAPPWTESAEDTPPPQIISGTTGSYELRDSSVAHSGLKSFHLVFPSFTDQFFTIDRNLIPQANSHLLFYQMAKITTTANSLSAEVSSDGGTTWTPVWTRNGVANSNAAEKTWTAVDVNLSAYAGQSIRVRFAARYGGSSFTNPGSTYGFFIDDVTATNLLTQASLQVTELPGNATSFILDEETAGVPLEDGQTFQVRVSPGIGSRWFDYSAAKTVTVKAVVNYADWASTFYLGLTGGFTGDPDGDKVANGAEYAFSLSPVRPDLNDFLPQAEIENGAIFFDYDQPEDISDLIYGAQWSSDLVVWTTLPDTGSGLHHHFEVSTAGKRAVFLRHVITQR